MPTQLSDIFVEDATTFTFDSSHETWIVSKGVEVGSGERYAFYSAYSNSALVNSGTIYSETLYAVRLDEAKSKITNKKSGTIFGEQGAITLGQATAKSKAVVVNKGEIIGLGDGSIGINSNNISGLEVENYKNIKAKQFAIYVRSDVDGIEKTAKIKNEGKLISDDVGIRSSTVSAKIKNAEGALIKGKGEGAILSTTGDLTVINKGKVKGDIESNSDEGVDKVVNKGKIKGDVYLGAGDDLYKNKGGTAGLIHGERGNDTLVAGDSTDQFVFDTKLDAATNVDTVVGFETGVDKILLDAAIFKALTATGALAQSNFVDGGTALDDDDFIVYDADTGAIFYDKSGVGGSDPIQFAKVEPGLDLSHSDFIVIA